VEEKFRLLSIVAVFFGAALLWLSLPPMDWWPLAWIAPVPWIMWVRCRELPCRRSYALLFVVGFCFWMGALHWLRLPHPATSIGWVALSFYFAFYLPLFVGLSRVAVHRLRVPVVLAAPIVWTGLELARAHLLTGMSMGSIAHTQYRWTALIQISDLAGEYGVTFAVVFAAASLARMLPCDGRRWALWPVAPAAALLAAVLFYGHWRMNREAGEPGPRIALIQGSVDIEMRYDPGMKERIFREYSELSEKAMKQGEKIDLLVWPETMFLTGPEFHDALITFDAGAPQPSLFEGTENEFRRWLPWASEGSQSRMAAMARSFDVALLLGVDRNHFGREGIQCYNSAAYVGRRGQMLGRYDKMHLVMFGEYVPFTKFLPWLQNLTPLPLSIAAGDEPAALLLNGVRIAPNICYESVLSHVIRGQVNALAARGSEPDLLINLTNDGWFWGSSELDMHLACGVFRAVECRKPFLIAANTGFSAWIDGNGRLQKQGPRRAADVIIAQPRLDRRRSWYLAYGDWFSGLCLAFCGLCGLLGLQGRIPWRRSAEVAVGRP
jgi:apolipoprotein N-acyltransferase